MKIGIFHGYNLTGSGSNEYTRYLAKTFLAQGHTVHVICREFQPEKIEFVGQLWQWKRDGSCEVSIANQHYEKTCTLHQIPYGDFYPVYITGKQTSDTFKEFINLTDEELEAFKSLNNKLLMAIFSKIEIDILHANHLVMQPSLAIEPCKFHKIPLIIYPHGSAIEYAVKKDPRYQVEARKSIIECQGLIIGNHEVRERICNLFPDLRDLIIKKTQIVGVGVDTTLFVPKPKSLRHTSIGTFLEQASVKNAQGKSPAAVKMLHEELSKTNYESIVSNGETYVQNNLDINVDEKLQSLRLDQPILLFVGALTVGKGLQSLICALPDIYKTHPGTQLVIIGAGSFREVLEAFIYSLAKNDQLLLRYLTKTRFDREHSEEAELWQDVSYYLNHLAAPDEYFKLAKRLLDQVFFLGRFNHEQLSYVFPCADLTVFPSVIPEAYPLVLMESLANGVLPMVSYFSGFKDGVDELEQFLGRDMVASMKIPMETEIRIKTIVTNTVTLLNQSKTEDMSEKLAKIARENYDWSHRARQMLDAFRNSIEKQEG